MTLTSYLLRKSDNKGFRSDLILKYPKDNMVLILPANDIHKRYFLFLRSRDMDELNYLWEDRQPTLNGFTEDYEVEIVQGVELNGI